MSSTTLPIPRLHEAGEWLPMEEPVPDIFPPDGVPAMGIPAQYGGPPIEGPPDLRFRDDMNRQVGALLRGDVTKDTLEGFLRVAGQLSCCLDPDGTRTYTAPDGTLLHGPDREDADLLWCMCEPDAWIIREDDAEALEHIWGLFVGMRDELDERIPVQMLRQIPLARDHVAKILEIANPDSFTLDELAQKIVAGLELSKAVADGEFADEFARLSRSAPPPDHPAVVLPQDDEMWRPEPVSAIVSAASQPQSRDPRAVDPPRQTGRHRRVEGVNDGAIALGPKQHEIRSHERSPKHPHRWRRAAAVLTLAAVTATGVFFAKKAATADHHHSAAPAVVRVDPRAPAPAHPVVQPPSVEAPPPADHIISIGGDYNPAARTGAIWFSVEDYAAQLGYSHLTMLQTYKLTDQCIQYMNAILPGGMSWDQATRLPSNARLPYPQADVMRGWIDNVLAQTGAAAIDRNAM